MGFIRSTGLIVDFQDVYAVCGATQDSKPFFLPQDAKQHIMIDLMDFLCCGKQCDSGHPQVLVIQGDEKVNHHRRHVHFAQTCQLPDGSLANWLNTIGHYRV